ncbi:MAG: carbohydrate ABC transporter permease [Frankia sp.]|nr:carbohydrate ABC transporter permease [Frankia sp.]
MSPRPPQRRRRWRLSVGTTAAYVAAIALAGVVILPTLFVVISGFRTTPQLNESAVALPDPWVLDNYRNILSSDDFWRFLGNSLFVALIATGMAVVFGAMAAFALSRYEFRFREGFYTLFTVGLLFPIGVATLPLYLMLRELDMLDSLWGVAIPEAAFSLPVTIVILRPFMRAIPTELEDAATVDGASKLTFFWRILLPLSAPALVTVSVLAFVTSWNAYLLPFLVFTDVNNYTLPLGLASFRGQYSEDTAAILAFTSLSMIPALLFFVFAQRRIVGGLTGAVKG